MPDKQWKRTERRIAQMFGGKRTGPAKPGEPDIRTAWLSIEVKERKILPLWIVLALSDARAKANDNQLGIAVLHETGARGDLVVLDIDDFIDWFGGEKKGDAESE